MTEQSITAQLLLAVRAREAFRTETDSVVTSKVSNVFPGATQQSLKLRRAAYVTQKKKEETKSQEDILKKNDIQIPSLQGVLNPDETDTIEAEEVNVSPRADNAADGSLGGRHSSIQEEYNTLLASISKTNTEVDRLRKLLIRAKLLAMDSASSNVEAIRLEYISSRLMRLRQLNVIPGNSERKTEARESYHLWCTNQRNLAVRKAKLDAEEMRKKKLSSRKAHPASPSPALTPTKKSKGITNIFGSEDGSRHVKFLSVDSTDGDRRLSFFGAAEGPVLPDPLAGENTTLEDAMSAVSQEVMERHEKYLNSLRKVNSLLVEETAQESTTPPPAQSISLSITAQEGKQPTPSKAGAIIKASRAVSFCESTYKAEESSPLSPGISLNTDFISFNFDEEHEPIDSDLPPNKGSESQIEAAESEKPAPPPPPPAVQVEQEKPIEIVIPEIPSTPHTPSAKLQRRFSMTTTKDNFTSFVETTGQTPPPAGRPEVVVPAAYREVSDEGVPIHNPKHLRLAAIMKSLSINSSTNLTLFEKEEMECRMQRCFDLAAAAVHSKFSPEGDLSQSTTDMGEFRQRIQEKESTIKSTAQYMKNIGTGLAEGYFHQIKDAHQLVLQSQLTRLERLQNRFPKAPPIGNSDENVESSTLSDDVAVNKE